MPSTKLREAFSFRYFLIGVSIAALAALVLRAITGLPFSACFLMALAGMLVNGYLATWEDNRPGGFNNPAPRDQANSLNPESKRIAKD